MITSDLLSVFAQLLSGTVAVLGLFLLFWIVKGKAEDKALLYIRTLMAQRFAFKTTTTDGAQVSATEGSKFALALAACGLFGLGLIVQSAVDDFVDDQPSTSVVLGAPVRLILGSETGYRFSTLFTTEEKSSEPPTEFGYATRPRGWLPRLLSDLRFDRRCDENRTYWLSGLGNEFFGPSDNSQPDVAVAPHDLLLRFRRGTKYDGKAFKWARCDEGEAIARKLYYDSLNYAIGNDVEGRLLARWEAELDFLGVVVFVTSWLIIALMLFFSWRRFRLQDDKARSARRVLVFAATTCFLSATGYQLAQQNYVDRTFGFFSSQRHLASLATDDRNTVCPGLYEDDQVPGEALALPSNLTTALRWYASSAERRALYHQTFESAYQKLCRVATRWPTGSWAVVMDVDETLLDNTAFRLNLARKGTDYSEPEWEKWVRAKEASATPSAVAFVKGVRRLGGKIVVLTNRSANVCSQTQENLEAVGILPDALLCNETASSSKAARFAEIDATLASRGLTGVRPVFFIGDSIGDFPALDQKNRDFSLFGEKYFVMPNPVYGSWQPERR